MSSTEEPLVHHRIEMEWADNSEKYIQDVKKYCMDKSIRHEAQFKKNKFRYNCLALPAVVTPILISVITPFIGESSDVILPVVLSGLGILNGVQTFFNYGSKSQKHNEYSNKYNDLVEDITTEIMKGETYRESAEVFCERVKQKKSRMDDGAPDL